MNDKQPWPEQVTVMTLIPLNVGENFLLLILLHAHFPYQNEIQGQQLTELPVNSEIEIQGLGTDICTATEDWKRLCFLMTNILVYCGKKKS